MATINKAPDNIKECAIYTLIQSKSMECPELLEHVNRLIEITGPMLDLIIAGPFRHYTLHNPGHSKKTVNLQYDTNFSSLVVDRNAWENGVFTILPLKEEILREGFAL